MTCYCKSFTLLLTGSHPHFRYGSQWALLRSFPRLHIGASDSSASLQRPETRNMRALNPEGERPSASWSHTVYWCVCSRHIIVSRLFQILTSSSLSVGWWSAPLSWFLRCRRRSSAVRCVRLTRVWRWTAAASLNLLSAATATPPTAWRWCITAPSSLTNKWWVILIFLLLYVIFFISFFFSFSFFNLHYHFSNKVFYIFFYCICLLVLFTLTKSEFFFFFLLLFHVFCPDR